MDDSTKRIIFTILHNGELSRAGAGCRLAEPDGEATRENGVRLRYFFILLLWPSTHSFTTNYMMKCPGK